METSTTPTLGTRIRARRRELGLTVYDLAKASGRTVGFISQIERDISRPSLASLYAVARALDTNVDRFLSEAPQRQHQMVTHSSERAKFSLGATEPLYEFLEPGFADAALNACITHIPPGFASEVMRHEGEDFVYLISGTMLYVVDGVEYPLEAGGTLHFSSSLPHMSRNPGQEVAIELWVGTMRVFSDNARPNAPSISLPGTQQLQPGETS
ncbi:HTH-type transcriptional regulator PuuR [Devosia equisanguinis]|uniref:HTH-type transcriptional regulator PuuR n=1 Tax=Devosia equisanguinis TaxID=2490941 RepID=A0A447I9X0_9HYPH|nr:XRE family transcriptional regulator [Devosia equisanguinis]VDS04224.1 HTH-type transcriptional regulator PuuR [Devosia equisanguinis]